MPNLINMKEFEEEFKEYKKVPELLKKIYEVDKNQLSQYTAHFKISLVELWLSIIECGIELGFINPVGLSFDFTISPGEKKEWIVATESGFTCVCPYLEFECDISKVFMSFIYNPKQILLKKKVTVKIPDYFVNRNSPLINYMIPVMRVYRKIMYIPKFGFYISVENRNSTYDGNVFIYCPYYKMNEKYAVNLYLSVFEPPHECLTLVAVEGKTVEEAIKIIIKEKVGEKL